MLARVERLHRWVTCADEPLNASRRVQLEGEVTEILQRQEFGEDEFNQFASNMILLTKNPKKREPTGRITDKKEEKLIDLVEFTKAGVYAIAVMEGRETTENADGYLHGTVFEILSYRRDAETKKRRPHLKSCVVPVEPFSIQYRSYITGDLDYAHLSELYNVEKEQFLPEDKARTFCQRVFELYQKSQNIPQPQPQNSLG